MISCGTLVRHGTVVGNHCVTEYTNHMVIFKQSRLMFSPQDGVSLLGAGSLLVIEKPNGPNLLLCKWIWAPDQMTEQLQMFAPEQSINTTQKKTSMSPWPCWSSLSYQDCVFPLRHCCPDEVLPWWLSNWNWRPQTLCTPEAAAPWCPSPGKCSREIKTKKY